MRLLDLFGWFDATRDHLKAEDSEGSPGGLALQAGVFAGQWLLILFAMGLAVVMLGAFRTGLREGFARSRQS